MKISKQLHLGAGEHRGALSIFPLWQPAVPSTGVRLADAGSITVQELGTPTVQWLQVTAASDAVLLLEGEILVGGQQDRVVMHSTLLAPQANAQIEVRCVEKERWSGTVDHRSGTRRATSHVRSDFDQLGVWKRVEQERHPAHSVPRVDDLQMLPGQCGVLIGIGGVPRLMELFADQDLLGQAWDRILEAAAREASRAPKVRTTGHTAREFIRTVATLAPTVTGAAGLGRTVGANRGALELRGITYKDRLLFASVLNEGVAA